MIQAKLEQNKPHINIGVLGHVAHGKTTLTAAITNTLAALGKTNTAIDAVSEAGKRCFLEFRRYVKYETETRHYGHIDLPTHADYVKEMIMCTAQMDGAILVVSLVDGVMSETREQILLARLVGVAKLVVFLNKRDIVEDNELLELAELEVREFLNSCNFPGDEIPIVTGSALLALEQMNANPKTLHYQDQWVDKIYALMDATDSYITTPEQDFNQPFLMVVEDVFSSKNRVTIAVGKIERGKVKVSDEVELVGLKNPRITIVIGIEMFRKPLKEGIAGDCVGLLLQDIQKQEIERGIVIAKPGSIMPHTTFESVVYLFTEKEESWKTQSWKTQFFAGDSCQLYMGWKNLTGTIQSIRSFINDEPIEMAISGNFVKMIVELVEPMAIEPRVRFAIRQGWRRSGTGMVSKIL